MGSDSSLRPRSASGRIDKSSLTNTSLSANVSESELSGTESTGSGLSSASSPLLVDRGMRTGGRWRVGKACYIEDVSVDFEWS